RGFQSTIIANVPQDPTQVPAGTFKMNISFVAPYGIIIEEEEPSLDLAQFFGNIGGYLTIWGLFGFLFGGGPVSPFGFVTDYCFKARDKESLMKHLGNDGNDGNDSEKAN